MLIPSKSDAEIWCLWPFLFQIGNIFDLYSFLSPSFVFGINVAFFSSSKNLYFDLFYRFNWSLLNLTPKLSKLWLILRYWVVEKLLLDKERFGWKVTPSIYFMILSYLNLSAFDKRRMIVLFPRVTTFSKPLSTSSLRAKLLTGIFL